LSSKPRELLSTELVDLLFDQAGVGLCLVAPDGTVARANADWLRSTGYRLEQVIGADILDLSPQAAQSRALHERARAGETVEVPRRAQRIDGRETWWEGRVSPVPMAGEAGLLITAREVTEEVTRQADQVGPRERVDLQTVLDQLPAGVIVADTSGRILAGNREMERIFGHPIIFSGDVAAYGEWKGFHPDGRRIESREWPLARSLTTGEVVTREEIMIDRGEATRATVSVSSAPIRGADGRIDAGVVVCWEVTERKRMEEGLRESAAELQAVLDAVPVAVLITHDCDARDIAGNRICNELLRLPLRANLSKSAPAGTAPAHFRAIRKGQDIPPEELPVQVAAARGVEVRDYELDLVFEDGVVRHLLGNAAPLRDAQGSVRGAVGAFLDITDRKEAEEAVWRSQATLDAFFEASPGILNLVDDEFRYLKTDAITPTYFGLDRRTIVGRRVQDLAPAFVEQFGATMRRVVETGEPQLNVESHSPVPSRPGELAYWRASYFPVPLAGGKRGMGVMGVEITDLKHAEAALRWSRTALAQAGKMARLGAWWIELAKPDDIGASPLRWSDEVYRIFGYEPGEVEVTNALFFERVHPEDRQRVADDVARAVADRRPYSIEHRIVLPDGTERVVLEHAEIAVDEHGRPLRIVGAVQDITEQKRVEEALREADRQKDQFLAMLAHELRNPLSAITSATHLIRARVAHGQNIDRPLEILERQTRNSSRLLDDLLDISRITRGVVQLRSEEVRLDTVITSAVESQRALVDSAGQHLAITLPHEPVFVEGDPTRLEQIVTNLLNNAAKYTPGGGRLALTVEPQDGQVLIRVQDDGVGIPADLLPRVFDQFVQAEQSLARSKGGLGVGLTLVRKLVEMHGGSIEARSEGVGKGSEFVVRLPAKRQSRHAGPTGSAAASAGRTRRRILLVEDNRDAAEVLADYLRTQGHEVAVAHDGPAALDVAARADPEIVLLDLGLPGMDGYEVARRLRHEGASSAPVLIALTGYGQEEDRKRASEAGFAHHLTKPFEPEALERLLARTGRQDP
jgi:PAS domain S-box-containing protein